MSITTDNTKRLWNILRNKGFTPAGTAGIMGNMYAESTCSPINVQNSYESSVGSDTKYTSDVNSGARNKDKFCHDSAGYGLCQWTFWSRKQGLYEATVEKGYSIGSFNKQVDFMVKELNGYSSLLNMLRTSSNYNTCTREFCLQFERPAANNIATRQSYAKEFYNAYQNLPVTPDTGSDETVDSVPSTSSVIAIAEKEWNARVKEIPINNVKYNDWYYGRKISGNNYPWCMAFVQWVFNEAGFDIPKTASCTSFWNLTYNKEGFQHIINPKDVMPGDIALFGSNSLSSDSGNLGSSFFEHTGIIKEKISDTQFRTIEGNTSYSDGSQNNGGAVAEKVRTTYLKAAVRVNGANSSSGLFDALSTSIVSAFSNWDEFIQNYKQGKAVDDVKPFGVTYDTVETEVTRDKIVSANIDHNTNRVSGTALLTTPTHVESPFIILEVGKYKFGSYTIKGSVSDINSTAYIDYPNYVTSIDITKINGTVNQYTIQLLYQIEAGADPNMIDKIFSSVGYGDVYISYGDWNSPAFIYKREKALITNLKSNVDFANSRITYTVQCTSDAVALLGGNYTFKATTDKPSNLINSMLYSEDAKYHLLTAFPGMKNRTLVSSKGLLCTDDSTVNIEAKAGMDALTYLNYLVSCMSNNSGSDTGLRNGNYYLTICDDTTGEFGGSYFKITKVVADSTAAALDSSNVFEVDIGYPGNALVTGFTIVDDMSWALLYDYSTSVNMQNNSYTYNIDNNGNIVTTYAPNIMLSTQTNAVTETQRNWWTQMTRFPINATLELKGLLRPAMLMSYVRVNAMFYGQRHVSSGLYVITKQQDRVDSRGYRTTLSLTRVAGDTDTIQSKTYTVTDTVARYGE